jgi:hypothetical protein
MAKHVSWGDKKPDWPVKLNAVGSVDEILEIGYISGLLKSREVEVLGVVIDANDSFASRWNTIRQRCAGSFSAIPEVLPKEGLVLENEDAKRVGVWIMPDNQSKGMIETFLQYLVPDSQQPVWKLAKESVETAVQAGAKCRDCHRDKSNIHTWLAWQDPPGQAFGNAVAMKILESQSDLAAPFVNWFRTLFKI